MLTKSTLPAALIFGLALSCGAQEKSGKIDAPAKAAVPALIEALRDNDSQVREEAAHALGSIGQAAKSAVPALIETLEDEEYGVSRAAMHGLGGIGPAGLPTLIEIVKNGDRKACHEAATVLGGIGAVAEPAVPALIERLSAINLRGYTTGVRNGLVEIGPAAIPALLVALNASNVHSRREAAKVLGKIGADPKTVIPALIRGARTMTRVSALRRSMPLAVSPRPRPRSLRFLMSAMQSSAIGQRAGSDESAQRTKPSFPPSSRHSRIETERCARVPLRPSVVSVPRLHSPFRP